MFYNDSIQFYNIEEKIIIKLKKLLFNTINYFKLLVKRELGIN